MSKNIKGILGLLSLVLVGTLIIRPWESNLSPEQKWATERDSTRKGTVGSIADAKAPSAWNGGYGTMAESQYHSEVAISLAFARTLGVANLKIDTLNAEIKMLKLKLELCEGMTWRDKDKVRGSLEFSTEMPKGAIDIGPK